MTHNDAPKGVELLALPEPKEAWLPTHTMEYFTDDQMQAYARANVEASVAELQTEVERLRERVALLETSPAGIWLNRAMSAEAGVSELRAERDAYKAADESMQQAHHEACVRAREAEARAERLSEALREAQPFIGWTGSYPELHAKIDALLTTTPAQPGETE